jgi:hypothetical protein
MKSQHARLQAPRWIGVVCVVSIGACSALGCSSGEPSPIDDTRVLGALYPGYAEWCAIAGADAEPHPGCDAGAP